ncbi:hypothetical protein FACS1894105_01600 [Clostridia bacterium]|nr:hypothetical protein FACS1894105_01390 [Clostridia bacterium]GHU34574.1 hypothetical protein FACS1894105_01600 [Clostridia bacterium]
MVTLTMKRLFDEATPPPIPGSELGDIPADFTEPLLDIGVRDTCIQYIAAEDKYYMIGTTGDWWHENEGIRMWESDDMTSWTALGLVYRRENSPWGHDRGPLWAPEFHCINGIYYMTYSMGKGGCGLLISSTGRPEGPYEDLFDKPIEQFFTPAKPLVIDASLFQDTDGKVYYLWQNGLIVELSLDESGKINGVKPETYHELTQPDGKDVGHEGAFIIKINGTYYLDCSAQDLGRYDCMIAQSDSLFGPYGKRYVGVKNGGHNMFFYDREGQLWSTFFGNDSTAPFTEKPGALKMQITEDGLLQPIGGSPTEYNRDLVNLAALYGTASGTSFWKNDSAYDYSKAIDGDLNTQWKAGNTEGNHGTFPEELVVDLKDVYDIICTRHMFEEPWRGNKYKIEYSADGVVWQMYADKTGGDYGTPIDRTDTAIKARYMRLTITGTGRIEPVANIYEFEIWGYPKRQK